MVADNVRDFLENGNVTRSVNFPETVLQRAPPAPRRRSRTANVPNMVGADLDLRSRRSSINIADLLNKSRGEIAYTLIDTRRRRRTKRTIAHDPRHRRHAVGAGVADHRGERDASSATAGISAGRQ